jgi:hypothetical protein
MVHLRGSLEDTMKYLYLIDFWVPFPASEYSGLIAVIGADDNEVHDILLEWRDDYLDKYDGLIMQAVVDSQKFALAEEEQSRVVEAFTT